MSRLFIQSAVVVVVTALFASAQVFQSSTPGLFQQTVVEQQFLTALGVAPQIAALSAISIPFTGCFCAAANRGWPVRHNASITICIGMIQSRKYETHPANVGKSNSEISPSETAHTSSVAIIPRTGCFMPRDTITGRREMGMRAC